MTSAEAREATLKWVDEAVVGLNLCPFARVPRANGGVRCVVSEAVDVSVSEAFFDEFVHEARRLARTYTDADEAYGEGEDQRAEEEEEEEEGAGAAGGDDEEGVAREAAASSAGAARGGERGEESDGVDRDAGPAHPAWAAPGLSEPETTLLVAPHVKELADDFLLFLCVVERCDEILEQHELDGHLQLAGFHPDYYFEGEQVGDPGAYTNRSPYPTVHLLRRVDVSRAVDAHPDTLRIPDDNVERLRDLGRKALYQGLGALRAWRRGRPWGKRVDYRRAFEEATAARNGGEATGRT